MARRDEGAYPPWVCDRGATKPDGLLPENPPGGGSFARGPRWLAPYSPLRGCLVPVRKHLAVLATAKAPRRRLPANFKTGSKLRPAENSRFLRGSLGIFKVGRELKARE